MKVHLSNLGCKLNQAEVEAAARQLHRDGHELVSELSVADVHVVNTCTVTHQAARDSRKVSRRGSRLNQGIRTVVTGCWATEKPSEAAALPGVALVVSNAKKTQLVDRLYETFPALAGERELSSAGTAGSANEVPVSYVPLSFPRQLGNTRAALKVEDGCNMSCSFCIIPSTRGRQQSRDPDEAVEELRQLVSMGFQEVVVTGVQISSYRHGEIRLHDLVVRLLEETEISRLRLTSIAPWQFDERLIELWPDDRLCRHVHLSLQSGCATTLRRMRRPYSPQAYAELLLRLRDRISGLAVTTDVIVGFPGETEEEFEQSLSFVEACGFARTHVFTYSEREGTRAASLPAPVPWEVRKERTARLIAVGRKQECKFDQSFGGSTQTVLWEAQRNGILRGTTDNYLRVSTESAGSSENSTSTPESAGSARAAANIGHGDFVQLGMSGRARVEQPGVGDTASHADGNVLGTTLRRPGQLERVPLRWTDGGLTTAC